MYSKLFPTHLVPSHWLYLFGEDNSVLIDSIDPLDPTCIPRLHFVQRSFVAYIVSLDTIFTLYDAATIRQRKTGGVPRRGRGVIGGKNVTGSPNGHGRKRGTFLDLLGTFWCTLPEGRPTTGRPATERPGWRPTTWRPGWMWSTGWCRTRGSRTGFCRSGRRVQSDVPSLPTVAVWNRRTMGSTGSPKRSTTEPEIALGTYDGAKATAATTAKCCWPTAARVCWSTAARVRWATAARVHRTSGSSGVAGTVGWSTHDAGVETPGRTSTVPTRKRWIADRTA